MCLSWSLSHPKSTYILSIRAAVLKLGVATLSKLWNWQFLSPIWPNSSQIKALLCNILHLRRGSQDIKKGRKISKNKYRGRQQKSLRTPALGVIQMIRDTFFGYFRPPHHLSFSDTGVLCDIFILQNKVILFVLK